MIPPRCTAALASLALLTMACGRGGQHRETPQEGYRRFLAAIKAGDSKRIWARLGPKTRKRLEQWKDWTNKKAGLDLAARELFLVDFPKMLPSDIRVLHREHGQALVGPKVDPTHRVDLLADGWLVRFQSLDTRPVTRRSGQVVLGPLGLRVTATKKSSKEESFLMVRQGNRWLVELTFPAQDGEKEAGTRHP